KFKKSIESNIGATEEEMFAGYNYDNRFSAILSVMEAKLVDKDSRVIALNQAFQTANRELGEAEFNLENITKHNQTLVQRREKLAEDIDYILYLRMERKKNIVNKRVRELREDR